MNKFIPLLTILAGSAYADMKLIYNQPATDWQTQALPIGNGRLGAMIFGDPPPFESVIQKLTSLEDEVNAWRLRDAPTRLPRMLQ